MVTFVLSFKNSKLLYDMNVDVVLVALSFSVVEAFLLVEPDFGVSSVKAVLLFVTTNV